jgi:hypothetical protein
VERKWKISGKVIDDCLCITLLGSSSEEEILNEITPTVLKLAGEYHTPRIFVDVRPFESRLGVVQTFLSVEEYPDFMRFYKIAVVDIPENRPTFQFHELVAQNRGFNIRFFTDFETAKNWLLTDSTRT